MTDTGKAIAGELRVAGQASIDLGEVKPKPTACTSDQVEASSVLWTWLDGWRLNRCFGTHAGLPHRDA